MTKYRNCILFYLLAISTTLTSCWDNFEERSYTSANVLAFGFPPHDTCIGIEFYKFNIDQLSGVPSDGTSGRIFNVDSLPYGRVVNCLSPTITLESSNNMVYFGDSIWKGKKDSIHFTQPIVFKNTSIDGDFTKSYTVFVNVHQVNPDSMRVESNVQVLPLSIGINRIIEQGSTLYDFSLNGLSGLNVLVSNDTCKTWTSKVVAGLPSSMDLNSVSRLGNSFFALSQTHQVFTSLDAATWSTFLPLDSDGSPIKLLLLLGDLSFPTDTIPSMLTAVMQNTQGDTRFARSRDGITWAEGELVPVDFPFSDFAQITGKSVTNVHYITLVGGVNVVGSLSATNWSTQTGLTWVCLNNGKYEPTATPKRKNPVLFRYKNQLVCFGGTDAAGSMLNTLRVSPDNGLNWKNAPKDWALNILGTGLSGAGVYVQIVPDLVNKKDREFIHLIGGESQSGATNKVWKAYLNSMIFARR